MVRDDAYWMKSEHLKRNMITWVVDYGLDKSPIAKSQIFQYYAVGNVARAKSEFIDFVKTQGGGFESADTFEYLLKTEIRNSGESVVMDTLWSGAIRRILGRAKDREEIEGLKESLGKEDKILVQESPIPKRNRAAVKTNYGYGINPYTGKRIRANIEIIFPKGKDYSYIRLYSPPLKRYIKVPEALKKRYKVASSKKGDN